MIFKASLDYFILFMHFFSQCDGQIQFKQQMIRDVKEIENSTLWEQTGRQMASRKQTIQSEEFKRIIFVLGDRGSGKSSLIKVLRNDFDPETKPNGLIEYWPSQVGKQKKKLDFYEVGNGELGAFIGAFTQRKDTKITCLICIDLSRGNKLIQTGLQYLEIIRASAKHQSAQAQIAGSHEDKETIKGVPVHVSFVGCKFDLFQKLDLESRKWISRGLRYLAHTNSCSILSCSNKNNQVGLAVRANFSDYMADAPMGAAKNIKDAAKPLFILFGEDRVADINLPSSGSLTNLEVLQKQLDTVSSRNDEKEQSKAVIEEGLALTKLDEVLSARRKQLNKLFKKGGQASQLEKADGIV